MTKEDAIKYLQQLYPNGGHCWLDEQRMEAIGMAINALQEEPVSEQNLSNVQRIGKNWKEEPVSEKDKLRALSDSKQHLGWLDDANALEEPINKELDRFIKEHGPMATLERCAAHFAEWGKKHSNLSVSKDLDEAAVDYATTGEVLPNGKVMINFQAEKAFRAGAEWQKDKIDEILFRTVLPRFMHGGEAEEVVAMLDEEINHKED